MTETGWRSWRLWGGVAAGDQFIDACRLDEEDAVATRHREAYRAAETKATSLLALQAALITAVALIAARAPLAATVWLVLPLVPVGYAVWRAYTMVGASELESADLSWLRGTGLSLDDARATVIAAKQATRLRNEDTLTALLDGQRRIAAATIAVFVLALVAAVGILMTATVVERTVEREADTGAEGTANDREEAR